MPSASTASASTASASTAPNTKHTKDNSQKAQRDERIVAIDILRGCAILGILLMNITNFAMPDAAYNNPTVYGGDDIFNRGLYGFLHIFADQKFMGIFSLLFGASAMLLIDKVREKGGKVARVHYLRNLWLLLFGLLHSIFLWAGDVLLVYALCALLLFFFRNLKASWQWILGIIIFLLPTIFNLLIAQQLSHWDTSRLENFQTVLLPSEASIAEELRIFRADYAEQVSYRVQAEPTNENPDYFISEVAFLLEIFARSFGMMLIGMAFYNWGIVTAQRSQQFYRRLLLIGFGVGLPIVSFGLYQYIQHDWEASYALFMGRIPNHIATLLMVAGYVAVVMLWSEASAGQQLKKRLAAVGRMAFSNYIGQSILASLIFYGWGLGLYGHLDRVAQLAIVLLIWALQLIISPWWLARFHYGPLEWLWRCLSYWRIEKFRKEVQA